ncbi:MAG: sporulation protein YqfD, partial [Clostridia bacterium]|nr:sporulation protein YqfD [Clostridia bacterium]
MLWLFRYSIGYLYIVIKGEYNENVLNLCAKNRITLWNSRLHKKDIETCISVNDFKKLRTIIRGSKVRLHILKKVGLPFKIQKSRNRSGLLVGFIILALFLKIMSGYIWVIDVSGNKKISEKEILSACRQIGITEGIRAKNINPKTDREHLLLKCNSLSWASLNIEGCRLTVNVTEIGKLPENEESATNLKANTDGIIKKIDVTLGNCVVKVGDT